MHALAVHLALQELTASWSDNDRYSWHSCRVTLATKLMTLARRKGIAPAESEAIAQALVRHKSPESIRRYGRWQRGDYADWIAQAMPVDTAQSVSLPLPVLFFDEDMQQLTQLADDLDDKKPAPAVGGWRTHRTCYLGTALIVHIGQSFPTPWWRPVKCAPFWPGAAGPNTLETLIKPRGTLFFSSKRHTFRDPGPARKRSRTAVARRKLDQHPIRPTSHKRPPMQWHVSRT